MEVFCTYIMLISKIFSNTKNSIAYSTKLNPWPGERVLESWTRELPAASSWSGEPSLDALLDKIYPAFLQVSV